MPDASKPVPNSITVVLNSGRSSVHIATIEVPDNDSAAAIGSVIARALHLIVADYPRTVYLPQLETLARNLCKNQPE